MRSTPDSTMAAIRRVLAGEREAYAVVVDEHQDRLRAQLAGYCRSAEAVEELCHLAFVEAYRKLDGFDPARGLFASWLLAIGRSCLLMELRRRRAEGERAAHYLELAAAHAPESAGDLDRRRAALERCLEELPPAERDLVGARYGSGRTSEEFAAAAGKSPGAVRMMLGRLRERLRSCIERRLAAEEQP